LNNETAAASAAAAAAGSAGVGRYDRRHPKISALNTSLQA